MKQGKDDDEDEDPARYWQEFVKMYEKEAEKIDREGEYNHMG